MELCVRPVSAVGAVLTCDSIGPLVGTILQPFVLLLHRCAQACKIFKTTVSFGSVNSLIEMPCSRHSYAIPVVIIVCFTLCAR